MLYSIISYEDGTEVTASNPDAQGNILVYTERFDKELDCFIHTTIVLPDLSIKDNTGFSDVEMQSMLEKYAFMKTDIIDFVNEQMNERTKTSV